nr:MAG TPA: hypothetical protein [Caudoviricetes sp.]
MLTIGNNSLKHLYKMLCCGLLERLYLFTLYALPLTILH